MSNYNQRAGYGHQTGQHSGQPQYNNNNTYNNNNRGGEPQYNNNNNNNNQSSSPYGKNTNSSYDGPNMLDSPVRYLILAVITFVYTLINFIPMAILSDAGQNDGEFNARLAGYVLSWIGATIIFLTMHFNINDCLSNNQQIINRISGGFIVLGGITLLVTNCVIISDNADANILCESDEYVCCSCLSIAINIFLEAIMLMIIGADIALDFGKNQKVRIGLFTVNYMFVMLFILIQTLGNTEDIDALDDTTKSQMAGLILILIFGLLAIIAACIGNKPFMKFVGIGFGGSVLLSLYQFDQYDGALNYISETFAQGMYLGIGGFITYDLVS